MGRSGAFGLYDFAWLNRSFLLDCMINVTWEYEICGGDGIKYMLDCG